MPVEAAHTAGLPTPRTILDIGITGHRDTHAALIANHAAIADSLTTVLRLIGQLSTEETGDAALTPPMLRLNSLLANGADLMAVRLAMAEGWDVAAPLPFGQALNLAINALPGDLADAEALLAGQSPQDPATAARAEAIATAAASANCFEMAEHDAAIAALFRAHLASPDDATAAAAFAAAGSDRAAMAARVMIDHCDLVIGIWDGVTRGAIGGTRHTIEAALDQGVPVLWINAAQPSQWRLLQAAEELALVGLAPPSTDEVAKLHALIVAVQRPTDDDWRATVDASPWRERSHILLQSYRRIERLFGQPGLSAFGGLRQVYEAPDAIAAGSGAPLLAAARALPGVDAALPDRIASDVMRPFAWADGVSTWLSDAYRGGMVASFFLSAFAIVGGIAYLPFASPAHKWLFAAAEFALLATIIAIFITGKRLRWHERWFETRRVAEYFRHAPILLLLGAGRATGRWPRGGDGNWPEWYVRQALRAFGLPHIRLSAGYLRALLILMREHYVGVQQSYHQAKAERLKRAQHNLDRLSESLFILAVLAVAIYLAMVAAAALGWLPAALPEKSAKLFTFLGVLFPTLGGAFAGVHYFGDFERFAAISDVTASKLGDVATRINVLLAAPDAEINYARVAALAHAIDDIVVAEIENWQAVFGGKHITVPV